MQGTTITSTQNPRVKALLALQQKSAERRQTGRFVVEGRRELDHCLRARLQVESLWVCDTLLPPGSTEGLQAACPGAELVRLPAQLYARIAYRGSTEGVLAVVREPRLTLSDLRLGKAPLLAVLERVEKPGNLGAVLRTADAAGADAVLVCDPLTDLWNPNLIRSSLGAAFTVPCVACDTDTCIRFLRHNGIRILTAQLQDSEPYYHTDMTRPTAIVMGTESTGLTPRWREAADAHIRIPMLGQLDSLNVSVSAAILLYEAVRQRQNQPPPP